MGTSKIIDYNLFKENLIQAYEASETAYNLTWQLKKSKAIHYGYTDETTNSFSDTLNRMNEVVCARAQISGIDYVLDAGCGIGGSSMYLAKSVGCNVKGINLSSQQVEYAKKYAEDTNLESLVSFQVADYLSMPFPDETFSVIWAIESVFHTPDKSKFLKEAYRVLKPNGRIVIADYLLDKKAKNNSEINYLKQWFEGYSIPSLLHWEELESVFLKEGFVKPHHRNISQFVMPSSKRLYRLGSLAKATWPFSTVFMKQKGMKSSQAESLIAQYKSLKRKLWKYSLIYAERA